MKQYVGARYVPKIATPYEWDINTTYEPLTIVGYASNSYTSKKTVPAGTQISNEEYWALTSMQSGAVDELRKEVVELSGDVAAAQADLIQIEKRMFRLPVNMQNIVIIGDSYGVPENSWPYQVAAMLGVRSTQWITESENGSGFLAKGESGNDFSMLLRAAAEAKDPGWCASVTDIIVNGGTNDRSNPGGVGAGFSAFEAVRKEKFPNAHVHVAMGNRNMVPANIPKMFNIAAVYEDLCRQHNYHYCKGVEAALSSKAFMQNDLWHPNEAGQQSLAECIAEAVRTGSVDYKTIMTSPMNYLTEYIYNGFYILVCTRNAVFTLDAPVENVTLITLPGFNSQYLVGPLNNAVRTQANVSYVKTDGNYETKFTQITFRENVITLVTDEPVTASSVGIGPFTLITPVGLI